MKYQLPQLSYKYDALEPHIDARTMEIHHTKHHQGYVNKLNAALDKHPEVSERSLEELLADLNGLPEDIRTAIRNNGGGHYNHDIFWKVMSPSGGGEPQEELGKAIHESWGSFEKFKEAFSVEAKLRFGSGWAWLVAVQGIGLRVCSTKNQDNPIMGTNVAGCTGVPILGLDVWEHAYYLTYQNRRAEYIDAWWNVVNWDEAGKKFRSVQ